LKRLVVSVKEIVGECAVYKVGDRMVFSGPEMDLEQTDCVCIHALAPILHYAVALREGVSPVELGLAKEGEKAYIHCPDPGPPYTPGGRVVFEVEIMEDP
jgi:uncharacterized repeat protein (TIGR04076 family)